MMHITCASQSCWSGYDLSNTDVPGREMIYVPAVIVTPRRQEFSAVLRLSLNEISAGMLISLAFFSVFNIVIIKQWCNVVPRTKCSWVWPDMFRICIISSIYQCANFWRWQQNCLPLCFEMIRCCVSSRVLFQVSQGKGRLSEESFAWWYFSSSRGLIIHQRKGTKNWSWLDSLSIQY